MEKKSLRVAAIIFLIVLAVILFFILKDDNKETKGEDVSRFKDEYEAVNSTAGAVQVTIDSNSPVAYLTYDEFEQKRKSGESFVLYLGYQTCPWCRNIVNPLLETAKENDKVVYYINVIELKNNTEDYDSLFNLLYDYLEENDGVKVLSVPDVYFFKDSEPVGHHLGSVSSQENAYIPLTEDQIKELKQIYQDLFDKI